MRYAIQKNVILMKASARQYRHAHISGIVKNGCPAGAVHEPPLIVDIGQSRDENKNDKRHHNYNMVLKYGIN